MRAAGPLIFWRGQVPWSWGPMESTSVLAKHVCVWIMASSIAIAYILQLPATFSNLFNFCRPWHKLNDFVLLAYTMHPMRRMTIPTCQYLTILYAQFTTPTRKRQNCLVLSCPCRRCELNWRQDKTVLSCLEMRCELSFVLSRPSFQFATVQSPIYWRPP